MHKEVIEGYELSPQQRRLWRLQQGSTDFVAQCVVAIEGDIMMGLLREALNKLTERHEILRTTFDCLPGMDDPIQVIRDEMDVWCQECDLRDYNQSACETRTEEIFRD